jgi:N-acetylglucosamine-6-phosphate deacetylase
MAEAAAKGGTAQILPTFITAPGRDYLLAIAAVRTAIAAGIPGILGLHLEGPFLSPHRPGIHPPAAIRPLEPEDITLIGDAAREIPILLTLAPEALPNGALTAILAAGVTVFAGHTEATADDIATGEAQGLRGATHLFNAMSQMVGRAPGVAGAVMASDRLFAGIIADGHHVDWRSLTVACRAMPGRLFLVTDAMRTLAGTIPRFTLDGREITLQGGRLTDAQGTLAGAHIDMVSSMRNVVDQCGVPLARALDMASGIPARAMGLSPELGRIAVGNPVSLVCLSDDFSVLAVRGAVRSKE